MINKNYLNAFTISVSILEVFHADLYCIFSICSLLMVPELLYELSSD